MSIITRGLQQLVVWTHLSKQDFQLTKDQTYYIFPFHSLIFTAGERCLPHPLQKNTHTHTMKFSTTHCRYHILHLGVFWMHHGHSAAAKGNAAGARANTSRTKVGSAFGGCTKEALSLDYELYVNHGPWEKNCHRILWWRNRFLQVLIFQATLVWWEKMGNDHGTLAHDIIYI